MNSFYGVTSEQNSIFFNEYLGASITFTGVTIITVSIMAFENFLTDNVPYKNLDQIIKYITNIINEDYKYDYDELFDVEFDIDSELMLERILDKTHEDYAVGDEDIEVIKKLLDNLSYNQLIKIYFKNNFLDMIDMSHVLSGLLNDVGIREDFNDPNEPPEDIVEPMDKMWDILKDWVFYDHIPIDRYERAMEDMREAVLTVDTDSNFINLYNWHQYLSDEFNFINPSVEEKVGGINILIYILSYLIQDALDRMTGNMNVPRDKQHIINMKNE